MKSKIILFFIAVFAIATLSFTFASVKTNSRPIVVDASQKTSNEPVGGFISEDKL